MLTWSKFAKLCGTLWASLIDAQCVTPYIGEDCSRETVEPQDLARGSYVTAIPSLA